MKLKLPQRNQVIDVLTAWLLVGVVVPAVTLLFDPMLPGGAPAFVAWQAASVALGALIATGKAKRVLALYGLGMVLLAAAFGWLFILWVMAQQVLAFFGRGLGF